MPFFWWWIVCGNHSELSCSRFEQIVKGEERTESPHISRHAAQWAGAIATYIGPILVTCTLKLYRATRLNAKWGKLDDVRR